MSEFLIYCFKVSIGLTIVLLFYQLALRNLTFFTWNRWYFMFTTALSFIIPVASTNSGLQQLSFQLLKYFNLLPLAKPAAEQQVTDTVVSESFSILSWEFVSLLFWVGVSVAFGRLLLQFIALYKTYRSAELIRKEEASIYQVNKNIAPFSFGKAIFLNITLHYNKGLAEILEHERVHVTQYHSLDVIWIELVCLLNWFNPFAWLLRKSMRQNLEYIADSQVVKIPAFNKKNYQYLLLQVVGQNELHIASSFNISSLKNRIIMMNKKPSKNKQLAKFLLIFPLMALILFACTEEELKESSLVIPPPPPPAVAPPPPPVPSEPEKVKVNVPLPPPPKQTAKNAEMVIPHFIKSFYKQNSGC